MVYVQAGGGRPLEGRQIFSAVRRFIQNAMPGAMAKYSLEAAPLEMWEQVYQEFQAHLGHYFRNFYHLIKLVHETTVPIDKPRYMSLARAQLSTDEHIALFYNALGRIGKKRFKGLIEKYHLLENLHINAITEPRVLAQFKRSAYGDDVARIEELLQKLETPWPD
jgi:hypothetical protein